VLVYSNDRFYGLFGVVGLPKTRPSNDVSARSLNPNSMGTARRITILRAVQDVGRAIEQWLEQASNRSAKVWP
jgi:hypothetical protein